MNVSRPPVSPDDLLALLAVSRLGKYTAAAASMGVTHTTVSRRIANLERAVGETLLTATPDGWELSAAGRRLMPGAEMIEKALGSIQVDSPDTSMYGNVRIACPEAFAMFYAVDALAQLQAEHKRLNIEMTTSTQRARQHRSGFDVEIVVEKPDVSNATVHHLRPYELGFFAADSYLATAQAPQTTEDLRAHRLIYYAEHSLGVASLESAWNVLPEPAGHFYSNSALAHVQSCRRGVGVALLPTFAGEGLTRVIPDFSLPVHYWAVVRPEALRRTAVQAVVRALRVPDSG